MTEPKRYRAVAFMSDCIQVVTLLEIDLVTQCGRKRLTPDEAIAWQIHGNQAIREHVAAEGKSYAEPPPAPRKFESWWKAGTNEREVTVDDLAIVTLRDAPIRIGYVANETGGADEQVICLCCGAVVAQRRAILSPQERIEALQAGGQ